ncbi:MAG: hypothetical protein H7Y43_02190, partial [Akkermansiaceae bacterium]|nr:hypothetical protein [Verrucomicrobiales bacterium]
MDAQSIKTARLLGFVMALSGFATAHAAGVGYLVKTGPVPLRFQPAVVQKAQVLMPLPDNSPLNSVSTPPVQPASELNSRGFALPHSPLEPLLNPGNMDSMLPQPLAQSQNSETAQPAANELLIVSPQMLIDYFKPMAGSTNGAGVSVLMPVNFTPATPAA